MPPKGDMRDGTGRQLSESFFSVQARKSIFFLQSFVLFFSVCGSYVHSRRRTLLFLCLLPVPVEFFSAP